MSLTVAKDKDIESPPLYEELGHIYMESTIDTPLIINTNAMIIETMIGTC